MIGVASGKGGTGKTTIAVNLALYLANHHKVTLYDLDVEEPNDNHFLNYPLNHSRNINKLLPVIDEQSCSHCGTCADLCKFNALAVLPNQVLVFDELCHGCGLCAMVCPEHAITEKQNLLGEIKNFSDTKNGLSFYEGILSVGKAMSTPIIHEMKKIAFDDNSDHIILDLPPGSACPVIEALERIDYALLVTEPTPAGEHDLKIAIELVKKLNVPFGIVCNRSDIGDNRIIELTEREGYDLLLEIPHDDEIIRLYSDGYPLIGFSEKYNRIFSQLWNHLLEVNQ